MAGRPTPTQEELNKIALGEEVTLSDDGSGPDPFIQATEEARKKHEYQTRQTHAERTTQPRATPSRSSS